MPADGSKSVYSTAEVAAKAGVHRDTLLRWLREGKVPEPRRDARGWRVFTMKETEAIARRVYGEASLGPQDWTADTGFLLAVKRLEQLDWDFADATTDYLTHGLHPYPAKFIPQIPNALIQELSSLEETVADVFCGCGTTLVESLVLKRHTVGVDASPIACVISEAKTSRLADGDALALQDIVERSARYADALSGTGQDLLFEVEPFVSEAPRPDDEGIAFWFEPFIVEELAEILSWCRHVQTSSSRVLALAAFSAILVAVSKQDSDTRYVRRDKNLKPGHAFRKFSRSLQRAIRRAEEFSEVTEPRFTSRVIHASVLDRPDIGLIDLMVCSPPYPNAWSYHLYHRTRMLWLGMDQPTFKAQEIGSHRKYSRKMPTQQKLQTFRSEMRAVFEWLRIHLRKGRYAVFVMGDSIVDGNPIDNADLLAEVGGEVGFVEASRISRTIKVTKKAFNPRIGKVKQEKILILQNRKGENA